MENCVISYLQIVSYHTYKLCHIILTNFVISYLQIVSYIYKLCHIILTNCVIHTYKLCHIILTNCVISYKLPQKLQLSQIRLMVNRSNGNLKRGFELCHVK